jgi:hypothetical protein
MMVYAVLVTPNMFLATRCEFSAYGDLGAIWLSALVKAGLTL